MQLWTFRATREKDQILKGIRDADVIDHYLSHLNSSYWYSIQSTKHPAPASSLAYVHSASISFEPLATKTLVS